MMPKNAEGQQNAQKNPDEDNSIAQFSTGLGGVENNIGTSLPYAIDYSGTNMLDYIRKGDIFYDTKGLSFGWWASSGHAAIVEGVFYDEVYNQHYIRLVEAYDNWGVARGVLSPARLFREGNCVLRVPSASENQINSAVDFAISQLGKPYDYWGALEGGIGLGKKQCGENEPHWYCSELIWAAYQRTEIGLDVHDNNDGGDFVWPIEFYESSLTNTIMKNGEATVCQEVNDFFHKFICEGDETLEKHQYSHSEFGYPICGICTGIMGVEYTIPESIFPTDYGFEGQYFFNQISQNINYSYGYYNVRTERLRTGYIEGKYLTLSARRSGANLAYLEYHFTDRLITNIDIGLAIWGPNESLKLNSSIRFEILDSNNEWFTSKVFDYDQMSKSKDELITYDFDLPFPVTAFRVIVGTNEVGNSNNRGRVVIGEVSFTGLYI